MKQGIERAVKEINQKLTTMSIKIKNKDEMANVARLRPTTIVKSASFWPTPWKRWARTA